MCRVHGQCPAFAPDTLFFFFFFTPGSSEVAIGFLVFSYLAYNLPQLGMHIAVFGP